MAHEVYDDEPAMSCSECWKEVKGPDENERWHGMCRRCIEAQPCEAAAGET